MTAFASVIQNFALDLVVASFSFGFLFELPTSVALNFCVKSFF